MYYFCIYCIHLCTQKDAVGGHTFTLNGVRGGGDWGGKFVVGHTCMDPARAPADPAAAAQLSGDGGMGQRSRCG